MKRFLVNLLICVSLALCGFLAVQWYREARLRADLQDLALSLEKKSQAAAELEGTIQALQREIQRLDALKVELTESVATNRLEIVQLTSALKIATGEAEALQRQFHACKATIETANRNLEMQNATIRKQNEELHRLAGERNEFVGKYNQLIEQYNQLVKDFNRLQEQVPATNRPAAAQ